MQLGSMRHHQRQTSPELPTCTTPQSSPCSSACFSRCSLLAVGIENVCRAGHDRQPAGAAGVKPWHVAHHRGSSMPTSPVKRPQAMDACHQTKQGASQQAPLPAFCLLKQATQRAPGPTLAISLRNTGMRCPTVSSVSAAAARTCKTQEEHGKARDTCGQHAPAFVAGAVPHSDSRVALSSEQACKHGKHTA